MTDRFCLCQVLQDELVALRNLREEYRGDPHECVWRPAEARADTPACETALANRNRAVHEHHLAALCLSGGGIRSASFALGVLQGIAAAGLLRGFDYLSTVSGGGYIGGWLSAWMHRTSPETVERELVTSALPAVAASRPRGAGVSEAPTAPPRPSPLEAPTPRPLQAETDRSGHTEPATIRHLRAFSNYLSPRMGLLSADTWTLVATYVRNLFLNWLVLVPMLLAVLLVPRIAASVAALNDGELGGAVTWAPWTALMLGFALTVVAITYMGSSIPSVCAAPGRSQSSFLARSLAPLVAAGALLTTGWAWLLNSDQVTADLGKILVPFVLFGVAAHTTGMLVTWLASRRPTAPAAGATPDGYAASARVVLGEIVATIVVGAVGGAAGAWASTSDVLSQPREHPGAYACLALPVFLGIFGISGSLLAGLLSRTTDEEDREWWSRCGAWVMIVGVAWGTLGALVIYGPQLMLSLPALLPAVGGASGLYTVLVGWSGSTPAHDGRARGGWHAMLLNAGLALAAPLFAAFLIASLSLATDWLVGADTMATTAADAPMAARLSAEHVATVNPLDPLPVLVRLSVLATLLVGLVLLMARVIDTNRLSLHGMYRNRLIRAYLGASNPARRPDRFTGFDPNDDVPMHALAGHRPLHLVNVALNLVHGRRLAWQDRKAASFTVSPLHSGSLWLGYRRSAEYAHEISLGTAVTISGAAASPNMGYHSSPAVTLLMTFFNARLGWWLGNPGAGGADTYTQPHPTVSIRPILEEALGLTSDTKPYVYLSDGGHFENLGLYEMVLRRCRLIVVSDASCDRGCTFEDLGSALRKIRIDLGVPITFPDLRIYGRDDPRTDGQPFALGTIHYAAIDGAVPDGHLLYLKPAICGHEPADVRNYASAHADFPHQSTSDQWFSEAQFESYRVLGLETVRTALAQAAGHAELAEELGILRRRASAAPRSEAAA